MTPEQRETIIEELLARESPVSNLTTAATELHRLRAQMRTVLGVDSVLVASVDTALIFVLAAIRQLTGAKVGQE